MSDVKLVEVGPRDGLQNEQITLSVDIRAQLVRRLASSGIRTLEAGSFVRADKIPQMALSELVHEQIRDVPDLRTIWLTPNLRGMSDASNAGVTTTAVFIAASDEFNIRNINANTAKGLANAKEVIEVARNQGIHVRGYVSTIAGCPYQGEVPVGEVIELVRELVNSGCYEVSLGDTIGVGTPRKIRALLQSVSKEVDITKIAFHGHDTYGMGVANALTAIDCGVRTIDTSIGGLGGCPFAGPGAKGNTATEDLVYALGVDGFESEIDLDGLVATSWWLSSMTQHPPRSLVAHARK
jgi:hydroxymethylglutaryl-CoA lyase